MITSIRLQDFKGHRDTTVPLGRFTALVGPNGSGKTSVMDALWLQSQLVEQPIQNVRQDWGELRRQGAAGPISFTSTGTGVDDAVRESAEVPTEGRWKLELAIDTMERTNPITITWNETKDVATGVALNAKIRNLGAALRPVHLYKLNAQNVAAPAYVAGSALRVAHDGTNTPEVLAALKLGNDEAFERIEREMRLVVPNIERVRIRQPMLQLGLPIQQQVVKGSKIYFDFRGAPGVPAHLASEGTLITLALLTILHSPERPGILLLDDFDQSLHPRAQMELVRLIKRLLEEIPDLQIVATAHSPYVLEELEPSQVQVFALRNDGTVASKPLSQHPEAERMKGSLTTGQLWTLDPEQEWVAEERAS